MAGFNALLWIFLTSLANAKIINGSPLVKENDNNYVTGEDNLVPFDVSKTGTDDMYLKSLDNEGKESEVADGENDEMTVNVEKGVQMQGIGPYGLSVDSDDDQVTVTNTNIHDTFNGLTSTTSNVINGAVIIGDKNKMLYCAKPDEVVLIERNTCFRRTYRNRKRISSEVMSPSDCAVILGKIRKKPSGSWSQTVSLPDGSTAVNNFNNGPPSNQQSTGTSNSGYSYSKPKPGGSNNVFYAKPLHQQNSGTSNPGYSYGKPKPGGSNNVFYAPPLHQQNSGTSKPGYPYSKPKPGGSNNVFYGPPLYQQNSGTNNYGSSYNPLSMPGLVSDFFQGPPSYQQNTGSSSYPMQGLVSDFFYGPSSNQQNTGSSTSGNSDNYFSLPSAANSFFYGRPSYQPSSGNQWPTGFNNAQRPFGPGGNFGSDYTNNLQSYYERMARRPLPRRRYILSNEPNAESSFISN